MEDHINGLSQTVLDILYTWMQVCGHYGGNHLATKPVSGSGSKRDKTCYTG